MRSSWKELSSVYIGTVIGAGFASGQEIIQFFGVYGYKGIHGIILATSLFSMVGAIVLYQVYKNRITCYSEYVTPLFGKRISRFLEVIIISYLFISFCIMLAGSGALFNQHFNINSNIGIYLMAFLCFLTLAFSIKGVSFVNKLMVPLMIIGIVLVGVVVIGKEKFIFSNYYGVNMTKTGNWITSAILYVSYNTISSIVVLASLFPLINDEKQAIKGGILGGIGLGAMGLFILLPILILYNDVYSIEIPMIKAAQYLGSWGGYMYSIILWFAMFTTAIGNGLGCINKISSLVKENQLFVSAVFCIISIPFAKVGFSNLVSIIYPLFGYLGLFMLIFIIVNQILDFLGLYRRSSYK